MFMNLGINVKIIELHIICEKEFHMYMHGNGKTNNKILFDKFLHLKKMEKIIFGIENIMIKNL
jgi:hypothetical protein